MTKLKTLSAIIASLCAATLLPNCAGGGHTTAKPGNLGPLPDPIVRKAQIANEEKGSFYYGRRYFVNKTRFWGYLREPGQPWKDSKMVIINEDSKHQPDRFSETGSGNQRYSYDQNYEYKIFGNYTGKKAYDPNSNLFLPEFKLTGYELLNKNPGWIFSPNDYYDPYRVTLRAY